MVPFWTYVSGQVAMLMKYWDSLGVDSSSIGSYHYQDLEAMEEQGNKWSGLDTVTYQYYNNKTSVTPFGVYTIYHAALMKLFR